MVHAMPILVDFQFIEFYKMFQLVLESTACCSFFHSWKISNQQSIFFLSLGNTNCLSSRLSIKQSQECQDWVTLWLFIYVWIRIENWIHAIDWKHETVVVDGTIVLVVGRKPMHLCRVIRSCSLLSFSSSQKAIFITQAGSIRLISGLVM